jgi:hypothetical protein
LKITNNFALKKEKKRANNKPEVLTGSVRVSGLRVENVGNVVSVE